MVAWTTIDAPRSLAQTLRVLRHGPRDPTTVITPGEALHATLTPEGPVTIRWRWDHDPAPVGADGLTVDLWGPGARWVSPRLDDWAGTHDQAIEWPGASEVVATALRQVRPRRWGATSNAYHALLPTVLGQRVTAAEAKSQWRALVNEVGQPAPGPSEIVGSLRLPPEPDSVIQPTWWFHRLGIDPQRARAVVEVARRAPTFWEWADAGSATLGAKLAHLPGIGPWTITKVLAPVCGDPDVVVIGDYHLANTVVWALTGTPRGADDEMLELLAPYVGQRGRIVVGLVASVGHAPRFGPRQRIVPIHRL